MLFQFVNKAKGVNKVVNKINKQDTLSVVNIILVNSKLWLTFINKFDISIFQLLKYVEEGIKNRLTKLIKKHIDIDCNVINATLLIL